MKLNSFQQRALAVPEIFDLYLLGGRSGGKSVALFAVMLAHGLKYGALARCLYLRRSYPSLRQPFDECQRVFTALGCTQFETNKHEMTITLPNGATIVFAPLDDPGYFRTRFQGHSYSLVAADEMSAWSEPSTLDLAYSLLRAPAPLRPRFIGASNPGPGSPWLVARFWSRASRIARGQPFVVPELGEREAVVLHSTVIDNSALDQDAARRAIIAGAGGNRALAEMFLHGTFEVLNHQFFALYEAVFVQWGRFDVAAYPLKYRIGLDHGRRAPFAAIWLARFTETAAGPDGRVYPRGSWVAFHETHSANADNNYLSVVAEYTVADIAGLLLRDAERLGFARLPKVLIDAAAFAQHGHSINGRAHSLADDYKSFGIPLHAAPKPRLANSLQQVNGLLSAAGSTQEALYISRRACPYLTYALTNATADEGDPEMLSANYPYDHPVDGLRYGLALRNTPAAATIIQDFLQHPSAQFDDIERQARAALRERQRWATKSPPPDMVVRKPMFDAAAIDRLNARAAATDDKPKSPPLQQSPIVRTYK